MDYPESGTCLAFCIKPIIIITIMIITTVFISSSLIIIVKSLFDTLRPRSRDPARLLF